jgi:hypothetical protein
LNSKKLLATLISTLFLTGAAHADVKLVAIGTLNGNARDLSLESAAPLENGAPGNLFGGIGSGRLTLAAIPSSPSPTAARTPTTTTRRSTTPRPTFPASTRWKCACSPVLPVRPCR